MKTLARYDAARAALEACVSVDEVKDWSDTAAAYEAYARQAKDNELRKMAIDIRMRAKRRLGELMAQQRATHGIKAGRPPKKNGSTSVPISLAEAGINKRLAQEARDAAALTPDAFERQVEERKRAVDAADAELLENAAEAMTIVAADDKLKAAMDEVTKAKRDAKTSTALYDALRAEVNSYKREAQRWMKKAQKSAMCKACKVALERDDE